MFADAFKLKQLTWKGSEKIRVDLQIGSLDGFDHCTYWQTADDWSYADAALRGSSHLRLPKVLQFFTGNIGLHHVHHLSARIPNYNLQRAHDETPIFQSVPTLSAWDGLRAVRLKLWDEDRGRLVTWAQARRAVGSH